MKKSMNRRSSILKTVDENQPERPTTRNPRRVSWHSVRIVKEFGSDTDEMSEAPKHEPMHLSDGSTNISAFLEQENDLKTNSADADVTMTNPLGENEMRNQTLMFFQSKEESHFTVYQGDSTMSSEPTLGFFDQLPRNMDAQDSFALQETIMQDGLEQTMGFFGGLDPRFVSPVRSNTSAPKFDFTPVHVQSPTSEHSPMRVDTEAKKLFDGSALSPIKCFPSNTEAEVPVQLNFEEDVNMVNETFQDEEKMAVTEDLEKIRIEDDRETLPETGEEQVDDERDENNSPVMFEVSQKILETSLRVMAEHNPKLEQLKMKARRLSDRLAEITQSRRRSSLLNSPADQINATLSEMFEKPQAQSTQVLPDLNATKTTSDVNNMSNLVAESKVLENDSNATKTISDADVMSDLVAESAVLEKQNTDLFSKSLNSSIGGDGGTYTVQNSPGMKSPAKPLEPRVTAGSFYAPGFSSPLFTRSTQMLDDIHTPTQLVTMNESEFMRGTMKLNDSTRSNINRSAVETVNHGNILNITTPTRGNILKSDGETFTVTPEEKSNTTNSADIEEMVCDDALNPPANIFENTFQSVGSSNTLPIAPSTPAVNRMSYLQSLNMLVPLEEEEEEEHQSSAINRFPHLAELMKEEKEWKETQGKNTSINYSKKYANGDSLIIDNGSMMCHSIARTPGKGMRGIEPGELFEEEVADSTLGQSFANSSIYSVGKQKNSDTYTMSSYGCCTRQLNPTEAALMRQLESQIEQLKVFGGNLVEATPEIAKMCESLKTEWIVYEERPLLSSIYYLAEMTIVDFLFKALNGSGVDKKTNEVLFCTAKKAEEAYSTALKLFDEMRITLPKSKFAEKLGNAFFKDRLTNPEKKETYTKTALERRKRNAELKRLHEQRMKELKQEVSHREQELVAENERLNQLYEQTINKVTENLKKLVK